MLTADPAEAFGGPGRLPSSAGKGPRVLQWHRAPGIGLQGRLMLLQQTVGVGTMCSWGSHSPPSLGAGDAAEGAEPGQPVLHAPSVPSSPHLCPHSPVRCLFLLFSQPPSLSIWTKTSQVVPHTHPSLATECVLPRTPSLRSFRGQGRGQRKTGKAQSEPPLSPSAWFPEAVSVRLLCPPAVLTLYPRLSEGGSRAPADRGALPQLPRELPRLHAVPVGLGRPL